MMFLSSLVTALIATAATLTAAATEEWFYLKTASGLYLSSSVSFDGYLNYVILGDEPLAQPVSIFAGDDSIIVNSTGVIGASTHGPLYLSDRDGFSKLYKDVLLGDEMAGQATSGFSVADDGTLSLDMDGFYGFYACTASKTVKQLYWANQERDAVASCEKVTLVKA